ncbi:hypothetical protein SDC9_121737 [bioreactor metagenome]|uniref:Abortive infection protein AbiGI n=1 Tax=bioreactor metagenome TaxID=1076179 RepID=A0A645CCX8_9ZZZZ|nr:hypothetical protein [Erysipelotrichaceae bacterium]
MIEIENFRLYSANELNRLGYSSNSLTDLTRQKAITRLQRGFYIIDDEFDELELIIQLFPESILCLNSALYYYGYLQTKPREYAVAVDKSHNRNKYRHNSLPLKAYFRDDKYIRLGLHQSSYRGRTINIYDRERTICDCIRRKNLLDHQTYQAAIKGYVGDTAKDINRLLTYASILKIQKKVELIMEAWL